MLKCPACQHPKSKVRAARGATRYRECRACKHRWLTVEQSAIEFGALATAVLRRVCNSGRAAG